MAIKQKGEAATAGKGALDFASNSGRMSMVQSGDTFDVIWNGGTVYVKSPGFSQALGAGKPWIRIPSGKAGLSDFASLDIFNPLRQFDLLKKAGHFSADGSEVVRGVETTRYVGQVDTQKFVEEFLSNLPNEDRPDSVAAGSFAVTAWIDRDGYLRRVVYDFPDMGSEDPAGTLALELYDFGASVDTTPPAEDEVADLPRPSTPEVPTSANANSFTVTSGGTLTIQGQDTPGR